MLNPATITEDEYQEAVEGNAGYCTKRQSFTHDCAEPDARNYECPECGEAAVFGAAQALLEGLITTV